MRLKPSSTIYFLLIFAFATGLSFADDEVYRWVDEDGVVHYGDRPPKDDTAEIINIKADQSSGLQDSQAATENDDLLTEPEEPSYAQQLRDKRAAGRKERAEEQKIIDEACKQRRLFVTEFEPSTRVIIETDEGEIVRMDDNERLGLLNEAKSFIAANCDN